MTRWALAAAIPLFLLGTLAGTVVDAPRASAEPPPPCTFELSPPLVEQATVTATVTPAACAPPGAATVSVACLQALTEGSTMLCSQGRGTEGARVELPLTPGVTYRATGRGLPTWLGQDPAPLWQLLGPIEATL